MSSATMRAVRWHGRGDVRVDRVPLPPPPGPGQVRVAVAWTGVCGTDREEWRHGPLFIPADAPHPLTGMRAPVTLGHEIAGHVLDVGAGVTHVRAGDLVAIDPNLFCGTCWWCVRHMTHLCPSYASLGQSRDGGLAEQVLAEAFGCIPVAAGTDPATAALAEPLSVAVRTMRRARLALGESVAILGGGMIGIASLVAARAAGAGAVIVLDPLAVRRDLARRLGADLVLDTADPAAGDALRAATDGRGADVVVEAAGVAGAVATALGLARRGGRCLLAGLSAHASEVDTFALAVRELELIGVMSHIWDEDFAAAVRLLERGALRADDVVGVRVALEDAVEHGFAAIGRPDVPGVKVLVSPALAPR